MLFLQLIILYCTLIILLTVDLILCVLITIKTKQVTNKNKKVTSQLICFFCGRKVACYNAKIQKKLRMCGYKSQFCFLVVLNY